jgi:hypothetical protein
MSPLELRDSEAATAYLLQGLWLQRVRQPAPACVHAALEWSLEMVTTGQPLPLVGFVADLGSLAFGAASEGPSGRSVLAVPGIDSGRLRAYEDHVLGKLYADWSFARAADALHRYAAGRNQARGLAFLLNQFRERAGFPGVLIPPGAIKAALELPTEDALARGWQALEQGGPHPLLVLTLEGLIAAVRLCADVLAPEDVFELEHGTALQPLGERLALRQVLQAASYLDAALPQLRRTTASNRQEVPTHILDEDTYPVGGFASLSTQGSIESLLHSQLAYMEKVERPDLFDVKYLRDELLYYSRDENEFRRRRRTIAVIFLPELVQARFKDASLPWQRGILMLALLYVLVEKLRDWLSNEALSVVFYFPVGKTDSLRPERDLLETLLRERVAAKMVEFVRFTKLAEVERDCAQRARRSICHCLAMSTDGRMLRPEGTEPLRLQINGAAPAVGTAEEEPMAVVEDIALESWSTATRRLLSHFISPWGPHHAVQAPRLEGRNL